MPFNIASFNTQFRHAFVLKRVKTISVVPPLYNTRKGVSFCLYLAISSMCKAIQFPAPPSDPDGAVAVATHVIRSDFLSISFSRNKLSLQHR